MYNFIFQEPYAFTPIVPHKLYLGDYQWMMIGALPLMLLYNHKRGYRLKCFFIFYPIHIILLALLSHFGISVPRYEKCGKEKMENGTHIRQLCQT